ncbi:MAG: hypothetical protein CMC55_01215 [Flavobacteriaceae bacterium]|uniref:sulfotransferase domain-containing protein n=1 Tax=Bizionia echini TaxID=649333 RepID=UPI000C8CBD49|nr:hypothetical protein [Flavobacteriaceae bacterium]
MQNLKRYIKNIIKAKETPLLKVYSHPRSGTHFLEAFLANNFYSTQDLALNQITWGHWSNRLVKPDGNPYGKLFGNHYFADKNKNNLPKIYIVRDGRAVAYSIWKTPNFLHKDMSNLSFKTFLKTPIDWCGSPSAKTEANLTILEHWAKHVQGWSEFVKDNNNNGLIVKYEDLVTEPYEQYLRIHNMFFTNQNKIKFENLNVISKPVGLLPNNAKIDTWKAVFDDEDLLYFDTIVNSLSLSFKYI